MKEKSLNRTVIYGESTIQRYGVFAFLLLFFLANCIFTSNFFSISTVWLLFIQAFPVIICGLGMTFVIASGGIDISVGAAMAFAGTICAKLFISSDVPFVAAVAISLLGSIVFGLINGFIIARFDAQPIVITLVMMLVGRGLAQVVTSGKPVSFSYTILNKIATFRFWKQGMPLQLPIAFIFILFVSYIFSRTVFGKQIQAIGDGKEASRLAGVNIFSVTTLVYVISAFSGGISSIIEIGRLSNAEASQLGLNIEMNAIAAVAVGGTPMSGGKPHVWGTVAGALIMQLTSMTINMNNVLSSWGMVAKAIILVIAVFLQNYRSDF